MNVQEGKRFRRSFYGYNRAAVDAEFGRLMSQTDSLIGERENMQSQISTLNEEKDFLNREQSRLNASLSTSTTQIVELETSLARAKGENDTLTRAVEAHKAENNALQIRCEQLRERDRDYSMREREFAELQSSVSSIMSVTKRAADRLFQKAMDNQEQVTQIAGDAAREVAAIRADMNRVREQLNEALDMVQDRIDRVDASLTGAVHKLVAIKHDDGLQLGDQRPSILDEVEHLLNMRAGDSDGAYTVPSLGPYGAKLVADTAQRVNDGRITARPSAWDGVEVHKVVPGSFSSSQQSILEANKLLERGGVTAAEYYDANPQFVPDPIEHEDEYYDDREDAAAEDYSDDYGSDAEAGYDSDYDDGYDESDADEWNSGYPSDEEQPIPMPAPQAPRIGFTASFDAPAENPNSFAPGSEPGGGFLSDDYYQPAQVPPSAPQSGGFFDRRGESVRAHGPVYAGDTLHSHAGSYECYPARSYSFRPYVEEVAPEASVSTVQPRMRRGKASKKVTVRPVVRRK